MIDLTYEELIQVLECCLRGECYASQCRVFNEMDDEDYCSTVALQCALDFIKKQNAEIKRLNERIKANYKEMTRIALMTVETNEKDRSDSNAK